MKKNFLFLTLIAFVLFSCDSLDSKKSSDKDDKDDKKEQVCNTDTAIEYNDNMIDIQSDIDQALVDLIDAIDTGDAETIEEAQDDVSMLCDDAIDDVEDMDDFDGKDDFKEEMINLIEMYQNILEDELADIIFIAINYEELSGDDWDEISDLYDSALQQYDIAFEEFRDFQGEFSEEWDFDIE